VRGVAQVSRAPIWIDDTAGVTLMEMRAKVRRLLSQLKVRGEASLSLVVVDYLQLMVSQGGRSENRQQEIAEISRGLKILARDLDVPVLAIAQLSRAVEQRHDKRPLLSDLRDSGALEQDADMVMFLYRDEYYNPDSDDKGIAEIIVGKHRNGPTGKVQLAWMEQYTKFASLARRI
jgi:replicative DNA helicase